MAADGRAARNTITEGKPSATFGVDECLLLGNALYISGDPLLTANMSRVMPHILAGRPASSGWWSISRPQGSSGSSRILEL
jgi:hypothetical protein